MHISVDNLFLINFSTTWWNLIDLVAFDQRKIVPFGFQSKESFQKWINICKDIGVFQNLQ